MRRVVLPASKSITNRVLLLGLFMDIKVENVLISEDSEVMLAALSKLGRKIVVHNQTDKSLDVEIVKGDELPEIIELDVGNAGTATRFLTAALSFFKPDEVKEFVLTGTERMHNRPIADLLKAMEQLGAKIECLENEGYLPLKIYPQRLDAESERMCTVPQNVSSQYLSALLLAATFWPGVTRIKHTGKQLSQTYVLLTYKLLLESGVCAQYNQKLSEYVVHGGYGLQRREFRIEPDISAASYWVARSALLNEEILLLDVFSSTNQGDYLFIECLKKAGLEVQPTEEGLLLMGVERGLSFSKEIDCHNFPDAAMTLAIVIAVSSQTVNLTGLENLRVKESDRLTALRVELGKVGVLVEEHDGGIIVRGIDPADLQHSEIETYKDHRVAMCFAVLQLLKPQIEILDPGCVGKTYPTFWQDW